MKIMKLILLVIIISVILVFAIAKMTEPQLRFAIGDSTYPPAPPLIITLTGTYMCLPLHDTSQPDYDCAFGIKTDSGEYYAVNFGASAGSMADFRANSRISAKGTITLSEYLNPNSWAKFDAKGLFTILEKPVVIQ